MSTLSNWPPQLDLMQRFRGSPAAFPASFQSTATRIFVVWLSKICTTSIVSATIPGYLFAMMRPIQSASGRNRRSEEHTSELQSLMRISYAVFCWNKKITKSDKDHVSTLTNYTKLTNNE